MRRHAMDGRIGILSGKEGWWRWMRCGRRHLGEAARKRFFIEKRSKKLLFTAGSDLAGANAPKDQKFFASFFSKKKRLT
jgi:hypothetical protein